MMRSLMDKIDFIGCPKNVLDVEPRCTLPTVLLVAPDSYVHPAWIWLVVLIMFLQVIIIALQDRLGPAFFLPARVCICHFPAATLRHARSSSPPRILTTTTRSWTFRTLRHLRHLWEIVPFAWILSLSTVTSLARKVIILCFVACTTPRRRIA